MEFQALLGAVTLMLAGVLLIALVYGYVTLPIIVGVVLLVDGLLLALNGLVTKVDVSAKKYRMVWGAIIALVGVAVVAVPYYGGSVYPFVIGVAMVLMGALVLYGEAYGGRQK
jgi:uncharacterized membrane protein HdeD (DUF308 family)